MQQIDPQQTGVKALYCRQQMVMQHLLQQQWPKKAEADPVAPPSTAMLSRPRASSFFMV